ESIIRDLVDVSIKMRREQAMKAMQHRAAEAAEERILDALLPPARDLSPEENKHESGTRQIFRKKFREGELDDKEIEIDIAAASVGVEIMAPPGMEDMTSQLQSMFSSLGRDKTKKAKMTVKKAFKQLQDEEIGRA